MRMFYSIHVCIQFVGLSASRLGVGLPAIAFGNHLSVLLVTRMAFHSSASSGSRLRTVFHSKGEIKSVLDDREVIVS